LRSGLGSACRPYDPAGATGGEHGVRALEILGRAIRRTGQIFSVGNVVRVEASPPPPDFPFPHATEDRIVGAGTQMQVLGVLDLPGTAATVAAGVSPTLAAAFDGALVRAGSGKAYVPAGHRGRSLGAVDIAAAQIEFFEDAYQGGNPKLRARLTIGGVVYDLSVPADAARTRWKTGGLAALQADVQAGRRLHVRVGLSRPFPAMPNQCYAQSNTLLHGSAGWTQ
jgi:hypothetical protein